MGPYCKYCGQRCFVPFPMKTPKHILDAYRKGSFSVDIIATCQTGQQHEKDQFGYSYDDVKKAVEEIEAKERMQEDARLKIQTAAQRAYDVGGMLALDLPIRSDTACKHLTGDTLFDFLVLEINECAYGDSQEEIRENALHALDTAISDLNRAKYAIQDVDLSNTV